MVVDKGYSLYIYDVIYARVLRDALQLGLQEGFDGSIKINDIHLNKSQHHLKTLNMQL